jgi:phosphoribosylglycinamide formyltransferase-1
MDFVVLSSSRGTTFQAVIDRMNDGSLQARCAGLIADRADRGCVEKAKAANLPVVILERAKDESREAYDKRLDAAVRKLFGALPSPSSAHVIAALGWMFILSPWFVGTWKNRILNVHPSLLPKYPGGHAIADVLAAKEKETGMTIHIVDEGVDTGPIVVQKKCSILSADTEAILKDRVQALEKEWYPKTLQMIHAGELQI